jgi:hypothetical protein
METINEKVEPNTGLLLEVDRPKGNIGSTSTSSTGWSDRFEDWINFLKDVLKILTD